MKHAYLIMAHEDIYTLERLVSLLDHPNNDIFIHIDIKSDIKLDNKRFSLKYSNMYIMDAMDVRWADISQVKCELDLFKLAKSNMYDYYHLLSGSDLPLKTQNEIHKFFLINKGKEFVHFSDEKNNASTRFFISKYHLFQKNMPRYKFSPVKVINKISLAIQGIVRIDRIKKQDIILKKGANWVSITHEFLEYLLSNESKIIDRFRYTKSPDEFFIQTVIFNSSYRENLYSFNNDDNYIACMRKIDWKRGNPYVYHIDDYEDLINSEYLFARKFNSLIDRTIIDKLFKNLLDNSKG